ncbi:MAG TPA: DUF4097 family beta strand repeat-containing protein [Terriglobales bacterium]|nr:DUF4097 family beta strand repeat-containing protein [Terriglobales bacterium]
MRKQTFGRLGGFFSLVLAMALGYALPAMASAEGSFDRTLNVTGAVMLEVTTGSGNIHVQTGNSGQVHVVGHIRAGSWWGGDNAEERVKRIEANPPIQQSGNDIRIGHIDDPELRRNISISYEITVPAEAQVRAHSGSGNAAVQGVRGPLEIESGSGNLQVTDLGGAVHAETGSGNVEIDRVNGSVQAKTGSGDIHASAIGGGFEGSTGSGHVVLQQTSPGAVRVETGSGGMELRGVRGSLEAQAGSGDIRAEGDPSGAWSLRTGSGGVQLKLASGAGFDLSARTSSGSIVVAQPVTVQGAIGKKEIHGKVRGGGVSVQVETGSGDIEIE